MPRLVKDIGIRFDVWIRAVVIGRWQGFEAESPFHGLARLKRYIFCVKFEIERDGAAIAFAKITISSSNDGCGEREIGGGHGNFQRSFG